MKIRPFRNQPIITLSSFHCCKYGRIENITYGYHFSVNNNSKKGYQYYTTYNKMYQ